ncbi:FG-GAP repeat domain-containing protein [Planctomycetota bacterium]
MFHLIAAGRQAELNSIMVALVIFACCATTMTPTCVLAKSDRTFEEKNGVCEMEAEVATVTRNGDKVNWVEMKDPQASGGAYMTTPKAGGKETQWNNTCELSFRVKITMPGDYFIGARQIGSDGSNSSQLGLNGMRIRKSWLESYDKTWKSIVAEDKLTLPAGEHVIQIRRREVGWKIDKLMIAKDIRDIPDIAEYLMIPAYPPHKKLESGWVIHQIDNPQRPLANGLAWADVNRDGLLDYLTSYESSGVVRLSFHPGVDKIKTLDNWPSVDIGQLEKANFIVSGDLDDDGNVDAAICSGKHSNVKIVWGPPADQVTQASKWLDGGNIPSAQGIAHYLYLKIKDLNGDGADDLVLGGQSSPPYLTGDRVTGLSWIEAPKNKKARRDLSKWRTHQIDPSPYCFSTYGFVFGDFDVDGDEDIAGLDSGWYTPSDQIKLIWWENPGTGKPEQRRPWTRHLIYQGPEVYSKPQLGVGDIDGNGQPDLVVQAERHDAIYLFKNKGTEDWQLVKIPKPTDTQWRSGPIRIFDLNGDGKQDIVGFLVQNGGYLPTDKAAVYWMEYEGKEPHADNWTTHVIKWGDGYAGKDNYMGEKWDQAVLYDVDRDGDTDIIANCMEYGTDYFPPVALAVVWFENPMK